VDIGGQDEGRSVAGSRRGFVIQRKGNRDQKSQESEVAAWLRVEERRQYEHRWTSVRRRSRHNEAT